jgi:hypothetical protein
VCYIWAVIRTLFIVSRRHTDLYDYLKDRFAGDDQVEVILDRRGASEGQAARPTAGAATRSAERRCRPEVDAELRSRSHAVVTLG